MKNNEPSPRVSVVAPVYNAAPFLDAFVKSFLTQTLPSGTIELIAVDDGSLDSSGEILDEYARQHENIHVIHQENAGWPGKPRNVGLAAARGTYVFFADPDDEFGGPEALERLADFADEHDSDVVIPKMVPKGNRLYAQWRYKTTQIDADLVTAFTTLTPQKLFRREFLAENGIRFPEEKVRLEDGQFLSEAYLKARRVSILTGYNFYFIIDHPQQDHLSRKVPDPSNYIGSVAVMSENVEKLCADADTGDRIINEIYFRKVLSNFTNSRLANHPLERRLRWLENQQKFVERFITDDRYSKMTDVAQRRTDLVRAGDPGAILAYAKEGQVDFQFEEATSVGGVLTLYGTLTGWPDGDDLPQLVIVERDVPTESTRVHFVATAQGVKVDIPKTALRAKASTRYYDFFVRPGEGQQDRRVKGPKKQFRQIFTDDRQVEIYTTKRGNLSAAVTKGLSAADRMKRRVKRVLKLN
ncbi:glycosyltransferase [Brevibacterium sp.]|uniref:glycosyltransferase n=1 Tax=Brevibacterium sp. TaxID=1701 RepID=UPI002810B548|nr:glycosyltransferase [Brevibacterium sp.]